LSGARVSDLKPLDRLTNLQLLYLDNTQVSDLKPLYGLSKLKDLRLKRSPIAKWQIEALQKELPNCKIEHDPFP
ncbi:MAG TPA: hypothetical protein VGJ26_22340, partial [Pirellulales bacterium]